ncbi:MAG: hypothetical protein F4Y60_04485 [Boseongicola sp. SB0664_bin_43]|uniref:Uncharacterized protein n=1 Tax=Boseongicola sp. SB0664_bin_43 TaxID=2604844 RepID=A0A6B0XZU7_9RHOB|nr:hypothetical protein [Boseongicola sp. SB0664_bin_43]
MPDRASCSTAKPSGERDAVDVRGEDLRREIGIVGRVDDLHGQLRRLRRERAHGQNAQGKEHRVRVLDGPD